MVLRPEYIDCQEIKTIGPVLWPVHRPRTEKQTDGQRDRQTAVTNILCEKSKTFAKVNIDVVGLGRNQSSLPGSLQ